MKMNGSISPLTSNKRRDVKEMPPLDEAYFVWLYSQVGSVKNRNRSRTYWKLLKLLHEREFTWSNVRLDENRAHDGKDLRRAFLSDNEAFINNDGQLDGDPGWMDLGCSVLELLIALASKLAWEDDTLDRGEWFWQLIDNLGLTECTDANPPDPEIVDTIIDKIIDRNYAPNGAGGLFPLSNPHEDQRDVELWYQAQAYLLERL